MTNPNLFCNVEYPESPYDVRSINASEDYIRNSPRVNSRGEYSTCLSSKSFTFARSPRFVPTNPNELINTACEMSESLLLRYLMDLRSKSQLGRDLQKLCQHHMYHDEKGMDFLHKLWHRMIDYDETLITLDFYLSSDLSEDEDLNTQLRICDKLWKKIESHLYKIIEDKTMANPALIRNNSMTDSKKLDFLLSQSFSTKEYVKRWKYLENLLKMSITNVRCLIQDMPTPRHRNKYINGRDKRSDK